MREFSGFWDDDAACAVARLAKDGALAAIDAIFYGGVARFFTGPAGRALWWGCGLGVLVVIEQDVVEEGGALDAGLRIESEGGGDGALDGLIYEVLEEYLEWLVGEAMGVVAEDGVEEDGTDGPEVGSWVGVAAEDEFWCGEGADSEGDAVGCEARHIEDLSGAKAAEARLAVGVEPDVVGGDVAVDQAVAVGLLEAVEDGGDEGDRFGWGEGALLLEEVGEGLFSGVVVDDGELCVVDEGFGGDEGWVL